MNVRRTQTVLDRIVEKKKLRLDADIKDTPLEAIREQAEAAPKPKDFRAAVRRKDGISLIAELKKASPSKGLLRPDFDPAGLAEIYENAGASALSVLTEEDFFLGSPENLGLARNVCSLPLLRKDFIFDKYQIYETKAMGADALLLITAILEKDDLGRLIELTNTCGLTPLVEVYNKEEMEIALRAGADVIGINNRDLKTMTVDLATTARLASLVPEGKILVAESGIHTHDDVKSINLPGVDAMLIGEALVMDNDPGCKIRELMGTEHDS
ncbi:MAG: indole-3-glycerol phosphate synthase TrpC [Planctomycetota bacterium]|nr:MAG: indole-3-glycerol phosphate synthase TrpC [Planctomycetota bacterium]